MILLPNIYETSAVAGLGKFINVFAERLKLESPFDTAATGIIRAFLFDNFGLHRGLLHLPSVYRKGRRQAENKANLYDPVFMLTRCNATERPGQPNTFIYAPVAQLAEAIGLRPIKSRFESEGEYQFNALWCRGNILDFESRVSGSIPGRATKISSFKLLFLDSLRVDKESNTKNRLSERLRNLLHDKWLNSGVMTCFHPVSWQVSIRRLIVDRENISILTCYRHGDSL